MSLAPGSRIGVYGVVEMIGVGPSTRKQDVT